MNSQIENLEGRLLPVLRKKQLEIAFVPPQEIGRFTPLYRRFVPWVKVAPWRVIAVWAMMGTILLRLVLGPAFVTLASVLQRAF